MLPRPSDRENFRYKIFLESEKSSNTIFYGTMRRKTFDRKSWYPHIMHEFFFDTRKILKHRSVLQCIFLLLWDKNFWQTRDAFPLLSMIVFFINFFLLNTDVFPYEFFRHCDTICFRRKIEITLPRPLFSHNFFHYQKISEKQKGSFMKFSGQERQKLFDKPLHTPLLFMENLYIRTYSKYRCVPLRFLSALWKPIQGKKVISSSHTYSFL